MAEQSRRFPILIQMIRLQFLLYTFDAAASSPDLNFCFGISPAVGVDFFDDALGLFKAAVPDFRIFPKIRKSSDDRSDVTSPWMVPGAPRVFSG
jgi:hypothetical protein